jgi:hypothetical protein
MKKAMLSFAITSICLSALGQGFNAGVNLGIPIGDSRNYYDFLIGGDVNYLWETSETIQVGLASGFNYYTRFQSKAHGGSYSIVPNVDFEVIDFAMIPIAGALRLKVSKAFSLGGDIGLGLIIGHLARMGEDHGKVGLYYRPMIGYNITNTLQITMSYRAVSIKGGSIEQIPVDRGTIGALTFGVNFGLNKM